MFGESTVDFFCKEQQENSHFKECLASQPAAFFCEEKQENSHFKECLVSQPVAFFLWRTAGKFSLQGMFD